MTIFSSKSNRGPTKSRSWSLEAGALPPKVKYWDEMKHSKHRQPSNNEPRSKK